MVDDTMAVVFKASRALGLTNARLADFCGVSVRTVQRWYTAGMGPSSDHFHKLARSVHPHDAELARELARRGGTTLEALGLVGAKPSAPAAPVAAPAVAPPAATVRVQADAIVYAVADALDVSPRTVRPTIAAAFARAHENGGDAQAIARHFADEVKGKAVGSTKPEPGKGG